MAVADAAGTIAPNVLEPKAGVELVLLFAGAVPKLPNAGVLVDGLPKMGVLDVDAAGDPNTGATAEASEELFLLAPNVNAEEGAVSTGFGAEVAAAPNANPAVVVALPKIPPVEVAAVVVVAGDVAVAAAPNVPNVGAAAVAPNVGTTLLADWPLGPKTKLDVAATGVGTVLGAVVVTAGLDFVDPKENVDAVVDAVLEDAVVPVVAGELAMPAPKLKLGVMDGPVGFWAPPKIGTLEDDAAGATAVLDAAADELEVAATVAVGFGVSKENMPLPTTAATGLPSAGLLAPPEAIDPKLNEGLAEDVNALELAVVVAMFPPSANAPKVTVGLFGSVTLLLLLVGAGEDGLGTAGFANVKATLLGASAALVVAGEEPKLNPVVVVEDTASEDFEVTDETAFDPKLKPPDPKVVEVGLVASVFSVVLELSVVSEVAVGLPPKLKPPDGALLFAVPVPLPKLNFGLSSELTVLVEDVTEPKVNPELAGVDELVVEVLDGTPNVNPVLGASLPSEL